MGRESNGTIVLYPDLTVKSFETDPAKIRSESIPDNAVLESA